MDHCHTIWFNFQWETVSDTQSGLYIFGKNAPSKQTVSQERFSDNLTPNIITRDSYSLGDHLDFRPHIPLEECKCQVRVDSLLHLLFVPDKVCIKWMERWNLKLRTQKLYTCWSVHELYFSVISILFSCSFQVCKFIMRSRSKIFTPNNVTLKRIFSVESYIKVRSFWSNSFSRFHLKCNETS